LAAVGVGQRAERVVVAQASVPEPARGHRTILAHPLRVAAATPIAPQTHRWGPTACGVSSSGMDYRHARRTEMGKIVISGPQNVSLDGVVQDPDGAEGFRLGGWFVEFGGKDLEEWNKVALADAVRAEAWLLGRASYEFFGARWGPRSGESADRL